MSAGYARTGLAPPGSVHTCSAGTRRPGLRSAGTSLAFAAERAGSIGPNTALCRSPDPLSARSICSDDGGTSQSLFCRSLRTSTCPTPARASASASPGADPSVSWRSIPSIHRVTPTPPSGTRLRTPQGVRANHCIGSSSGRPQSYSPNAVPGSTRVRPPAGLRASQSAACPQ